MQQKFDRIEVELAGKPEQVVVAEQTTFITLLGVGGAANAERVEDLADADTSISQR